MKISAPVVIAVIVVIVAIVAVLLWKGTSAGRFPPPPPIQSGLPAGQTPVAPPSGGR